MSKKTIENLTEKEVNLLKRVYYKQQYLRRKAQDPDLIKKSQLRRKQWLNRLTPEEREARLKRYQEKARENAAKKDEKKMLLLENSRLKKIEAEKKKLKLKQNRLSIRSIKTKLQNHWLKP